MSMDVARCPLWTKIFVGKIALSEEPLVLGDNSSLFKFVTKIKMKNWGLKVMKRFLS